MRSTNGNMKLNIPMDYGFLFWCMTQAAFCLDTPIHWSRSSKYSLSFSVYSLSRAHNHFSPHKCSSHDCLHFFSLWRTMNALAFCWAFLSDIHFILTFHCNVSFLSVKQIATNNQFVDLRIVIIFFGYKNIDRLFWSQFVSNFVVNFLKFFSVIYFT